MQVCARVLRSCLGGSLRLAAPMLSSALGVSLAAVGMPSMAYYPKPPTGLSYPVTTLNATVGVAIPTDTPTVTGSVNGYSVVPSLPAGLILNKKTGAISGTPTAPAATAGYVVYASNQAGFSSQKLTITVSTSGTTSGSTYPTPPASLSYAVTNLVATVGTAITPDTPTVSGTVNGYSVSPSLPAGLTLNASTGVISGTPSAAAAKANYVFYASNQAGYATQTLAITVNAATTSSYPNPPTGLSYPVTNLSAAVGTAITPDVPTVSGTVNGYSVSPSLPAGLSLNASTGVISGTPTAAAATANYVFYASNQAGFASQTLAIGVSASSTAGSGSTAAPSGLAYPQATIAATAGQAIATDTPSVTGTVSTWSVSPALPSGLSLNTSTGAISGTPAGASALATYTVTAANSAGATSAPVAISVAAAPTASLSYASATVAGVVGVAITPDSPALANATASSWTVTPALPAGLGLNAGTGVISGTPTAAAAAATYTVTAVTSAGALSAPVNISVQASTTSSAGVTGFTGLFQFFPSSSQYASSRTPAAMTANPWMTGARFGVSSQGLCNDTQLSLSNWNGDTSAVTGYTDPFNTVMIRMNANPSGTWNIQSSAAVTNMDAAVAGVVQVAKAAGTNAILLDLENYYTSYFLNNYNQTSAGQPILNSPYLTRAQMCAKMRTFGQAVGTSLWSRMPNATLYTFFGPTIVMGFTGGTGIPTSWPDANYANDPRYNMLPYFFLGMLDSCPTTGHIADYIERSYYDFTGLASIKRNMTASKNWVSIFFPTETAAIAKSATCWVPLPLIFVNPYFQSSYGTIYPGAYYVKNTTDQANYFTRNALYCLQQTPAGFLPGIYVENYDPWGALGTVSNMPATWETCLKNALAVYNGTLSLSSLMDVNALDTTLQNAFAGHTAWVTECK